METFVKVKVDLSPIVNAYLSIDPLPAKCIISAWYYGAQNYCRQHHGFTPSRQQIAKALQELGYHRFLDHTYINWSKTSA